MITAEKQNVVTDEVVFDYWQKKAQDMGTDPAATIRDHHFRMVEVDKIISYLDRRDHVLDIGCGNGFSTLEYAKHCDQIVGADYSPEMITAANESLSEYENSDNTHVSFQVEDARELSFDNETFDTVVMERCLINIPDRNQQVQAAKECSRVLKKNGLFLLAEVTLQGHEKVNYYREMFGLEKLKVHWHNTYVDEPAFLKQIESDFVVEDIIRFGMYGFISKVIHPMMVAPEEPKFDARINQVAETIAKQIPDFDGCSHQNMFVLRKK